MTMSSPVSNAMNSLIVTQSAEPVRKVTPQVIEQTRPVGLQRSSQQEDTVTLSSRQSSGATPENNKKPSLPVSPDEKRSLLGTKKSEHSFSVYG